MDTAYLHALGENWDPRENRNRRPANFDEEVELHMNKHMHLEALMKIADNAQVALKIPEVVTLFPKIFNRILIDERYVLQIFKASVLSKIVPVVIEEGTTDQAQLVCDAVAEVAPKITTGLKNLKTEVETVRQQFLQEMLKILTLVSKFQSKFYLEDTDEILKIEEVKADIMEACGQIPEALGVYKRIVGFRKSRPFPDETLYKLLFKAITTYKSVQDFASAAQLYRTIVVFRKRHPEIASDLSVLKVYHNLIKTLIDNSETDVALRTCKNILLDRDLHVGILEVWSSNQLLVNILMKVCQNEEAACVLQEVVQIIRNKIERYRYTETSSLASALQVLTEILKMQSTLFSGDQLSILTTQHVMALVKIATRDFDTALIMFEYVVAKRLELLNSKDEDIFEAEAQIKKLKQFMTPSTESNIPGTFSFNFQNLSEEDNDAESSNAMRHEISENGKLEKCLRRFETILNWESVNDDRDVAEAFSLYFYIFDKDRQYGEAFLPRCVSALQQFVSFSIPRGTAEQLSEGCRRFLAVAPVINEAIHNYSFRSNAEQMRMRTGLNQMIILMEDFVTTHYADDSIEMLRYQEFKADLLAAAPENCQEALEIYSKVANAFKAKQHFGCVELAEIWLKMLPLYSLFEQQMEKVQICKILLALTPEDPMIPANFSRGAVRKHLIQALAEISHFEEALHICDSAWKFNGRNIISDTNSPMTLTERWNLVESKVAVLEIAERPEEIVKVYTSALEIVKKMVGLASLTYISLPAKPASYYAEAVNILGEILSHQIPDLGEGHADTLATQHVLALLKVLQRDFSSGKILLLHILDVRTQLLGPDHTATILTRHHIQRIYEFEEYTRQGYHR